MCWSWSGAKVICRHYIRFCMSDACFVCIDTAVIRYPLEIYKRRKMCFCIALNRCAWSQVISKLLGNYRAHINKLTPKMRYQNLCMPCRLERVWLQCVNKRWKLNGSERKYMSNAWRIPHRDDPYEKCERCWGWAPCHIYFVPYWIHVWCIMNFDFSPQQQRKKTLYAVTCLYTYTSGALKRWCEHMSVMR